MAELKVEVVEVTNVNDHSNADRLSLATVYGYSVVTGKDEYKAGDSAVYFPVDSILPTALEDHIFAGTKMKLSKGRVRPAKIRGSVSQGLLVSLDVVSKYNGAISWAVGADLTQQLGVTKREPKPKPQSMRGGTAPKRECNAFFRKYHSIQHLCKYVNCFDEFDTVFVTEKIHGTNFRAGWVPTEGRTWVDRIRIRLGDWAANQREYMAQPYGLLGLHKPLVALAEKYALPKWTFVFGSQNVQLKPKATTYHDVGTSNVYEQCVIANDLSEKIPFGEVWYGEIYGPGIQKGYGYSLPEGELDVRFFDIMDSVTGVYREFHEVLAKVRGVGLKVVPFQMQDYNLDRIMKDLNHELRISSIDNHTSPEGVVVRSYKEEKYLGNGRKILKLLADKYLLSKNNTEFK